MTTKVRFEKDNQQYELGILKSSDVDPLMGVAQQWVRNRDTRIIEQEEKMTKYTTSLTSKTKELVNVFLDSEQRGKGLGYKLMEYCFKKAKEMGSEEVIWNSGPRYEHTAWQFYNKLVGNPIAIVHNYYGRHVDAQVWRKVLL